MKINSFLIFFLLNLSTAIIIIVMPMCSALVINEVLPNPEEYSDAEWVELYSTEPLNLNGIRLDTTNQAYNFSNITINDFLVVTKNKTAFLLLWPYADQAKLIEWTGMGLNNAGDTVSIINQSTTIDTTTYPSFSSHAGKSWARFNGPFVICNEPSPLATNNCSQSNQSNQSQQNESEIEILDYDDAAKFGDTIHVELRVYRGNTNKYAIYIYVEDDDGTDVSEKITKHADDKYTEYEWDTELELKCRNESGDYELVVEGLGEEAREDIEIETCHEQEQQEQQEQTSQETEGTTIGDFTYSLTIPNTIYLGQQFNILVKITNNGQETKTFDAWSYVYRASKCYSCEDDNREENKRQVTVYQNSAEEVELQDIMTDAEPGDYKLKIKVQQQDLKTPKEFTYNLTVEGTGSQQSSLQQSQSSKSQQSYYAQAPSTTESESISIVKLAPYLFSSLCLILLIYLIIKKI